MNDLELHEHLNAIARAGCPSRKLGYQIAATDLTYLHDLPCNGELALANLQPGDKFSLFQYSWIVEKNTEKRLTLRDKDGNKKNVSPNSVKFEQWAREANGRLLSFIHGVPRDDLYTAIMRDPVVRAYVAARK